MGKKITKINNLNKLESFLQLNYFKGFKYIDKAGEFLNHFCKEDNVPLHAMNPGEMHVKINDKIQLKTSPYHLWMHFVDPSSFDQQSKQFLEKADLVNSLFEPEKYTRVGWRSYLVYECQEFPDILPPEKLEGGDFSEILFTKKIKEFDSKIRISKLVKIEESTKAILFDIDLYTNQEIRMADYSRIKDIFSSMKNAYDSDDLLSLINGLLK